jgi:hypothetical protein
MKFSKTLYRLIFYLVGQTQPQPMTILFVFVSIIGIDLTDYLAEAESVFWHF